MRRRKRRGEEEEEKWEQQQRHPWVCEQRCEELPRRPPERVLGSKQSIPSHTLKSWDRHLAHEF